MSETGNGKGRSAGIGDRSLIERLAPLEVQDPQGRDVTIGELVEGQASVLVFIRHFG